MNNETHLQQAGPDDPSAGAQRLLLVAATEYDASVAKGVVDLLHDFDEDGFFDKVIMAFPFTHHNRVVPLAPDLVIHEYGVAGSSAWRKAMGPFHVLRVVAAIAALARRETVTVVRATDPCLSGLVGLMAARLARKPVCVSIHADFDKRQELDADGGAPRVFGSRRLAVVIERFVLSRADMVLPIRESLIRYAVDRGTPRSRIHVIPHGADLSLFTSPPQPDLLGPLELPEGRRIVSFAGRLSRENYVDDVLTAARTLAMQRDDFVIALAGGGAEETRLRQAVDSDERLRRCVRFLGFLPRPVIAALRQRSAVALCPMGGFSLIEACAAGAPVVAYDAEWHRELVIDGETGYLVAEGCASDLAAAIARLLDDPEGRRRMGENARRLALSRHNLAAAVAVKQHCYRLLMDGRVEG